MLTDRNSNNFKKLEISTEQEKSLKAAFSQLRALSRRIDKDSIVPLNNYVIVKVTNTKSLIIGATKDVEDIEIFKVSEQVASQKPNFIPGMKCFVPLIDGIARPCYYEEDAENEYIYISISSEQLIYAYNLRIEPVAVDKEYDALRVGSADDESEKKADESTKSQDLARAIGAN